METEVHNMLEVKGPLFCLRDLVCQFRLKQQFSPSQKAHSLISLILHLELCLTLNLQCTIMWFYFCLCFSFLFLFSFFLTVRPFLLHWSTEAVKLRKIILQGKHQYSYSLWCAINMSFLFYNYCQLLLLLFLEIYSLFPFSRSCSL